MVSAGDGHRIIGGPMLKFIAVLLWGLACVGACAEEARPILVLTGDSPLKNQNLPEGQPYGPELVEKLLADAGKRGVFESQPFARALITLANRDDAVLYALARTPEREAHYRWIGVLAERSYYFYGLRSRKDLAIRNLKDAQRYRIGVVRKDARSEYLRAEGFAEGKDAGLQEVAYGALNLQKILKNRIDLVVYSPEGIKRVCAEAKVACDQFVSLYKLDLSASLWLVASPLMAEPLFEELKRAHQKQMDSGYLPKLMKSGRAAGY